MTLSVFIAIVLIVIFVFTISWLLSTQELPVIEQTHQQDIETIDALLPQTQCGDCGFDGCRPYAEAITTNSADINRCLPGGMQTIKLLARTVGAEIKPLYKDNSKYHQSSVAVIDEEVCIGCVKCIAACPVDAILGAPKQMHSVIDAYCTGCELCIAPCPVDCISMAMSQST